MKHMLMIYKTTSAGKFEKTPTIVHNSWIQLIAPTSTEIEEVVEALTIPQTFITDPLDMDERPRIEQRDDATLLVIQFPYDRIDITSSADGVKYRTIPIGIIHAKDHLVTVCREDIPFMHDFFKIQVSFATHMKTRNTLKIITETSRAYIRCLDTIEQGITSAETELAKSYRNRELYTLLHLNESLIYMATSLKQMKYTMQKILHGNYIKFYDDDADLLDDALIELEQAHEVAEINQSNLNNLMDAYGNVIQNNVSRVLKILAAITIVLSVPTLVASIYGMNVPLPFQEEALTFPVLITVMIVISGLFAFIFYKKRFF